MSWRRNRDQFNAVNQYHHSLDFPKSKAGYYVGYHRLITGGKNYQARIETEVGAHTKDMNSRSLGICVGFDGDIEYPHPDDYVLLKKQVQGWQDDYNILNEKVFFHRVFNTSKTCPGSLLGVEWMKELLRRTPAEKPQEQEEKQKQILLQKISILQRLVDLYIKLKQLI